MKKTITKTVDLPFEEGKTYKTKFQTGESFILQKIKWREFKKDGVMVKEMSGFEGLYVKHPEYGTCPLAVDRLYPDTKEDGTIDICHKCGEPL